MNPLFVQWNPPPRSPRWQRVTGKFLSIVLSFAIWFALAFTIAEGVKLGWQ